MKRDSPLNECGTGMTVTIEQAVIMSIICLRIKMVPEL